MDEIQSPGGGDANATSQADFDFYSENLLFSIVPITSLIAAKYGQKAWTTWEMIISVTIAFALAFRSQLILPIIVSCLKIFFHSISLCSNSRLCINNFFKFMLVLSNLILKIMVSYEYLFCSKS